MKNPRSKDNSVTHQEALIQSYYEKRINFSTKPIDREKVTPAIKSAYQLIRSP